MRCGIHDSDVSSLLLPLSLSLSLSLSPLPFFNFFPPQLPPPSISKATRLRFHFFIFGSPVSELGILSYSLDSWPPGLLSILISDC